MLTLTHFPEDKNKDLQQLVWTMLHLDCLQFLNALLYSATLPSSPLDFTVSHQAMIKCAPLKPFETFIGN